MINVGITTGSYKYSWSKPIDSHRTAHVHVNTHGYILETTCPLAYPQSMFLALTPEAFDALFLSMLKVMEERGIE